jgi:hypothetical protein
MDVKAVINKGHIDFVKELISKNNKLDMNRKDYSSLSHVLEFSHTISLNYHHFHQIVLIIIDFKT